MPTKILPSAQWIQTILNVNAVLQFLRKNAINYKDTHINILDTQDTPIRREVERIMKMVDGVLLVVDAYEGCMPQTRFVLKKSP